MPFPTENVKRKFLAWMRARELQFKNMLLKLEEEVTAVVTRAGTDVSETQF